MSRNSLIYLLIGTLFFIFSNGNWIIPVMTWLSPILLLRYLKGPINPRKLMLLFLIILGCTKLMLNGIIPNDLGALTYILTFYYAILWFLPYWAHSFFTNRIKGFTGTLVFPTTWVSLEYLNTVFFGSWGSLAYTQYGDQLLMQLASFTGIWGIAFIILWLGFCSKLVLERWRNIPEN